MPTYTGNIFNNNIFGSSLNDSIYGLAGNDTLDGWTGNDYVDGGDGNDILYGWTGNDYLFGGTGNIFLPHAKTQRRKEESRVWSQYIKIAVCNWHISRLGVVQHKSCK